MKLRQENGQPKATEPKAPEVESKVRDVRHFLDMDFESSLHFKTPVICSFYSIAHDGDSLQLIFGGEHAVVYIEVEIQCGATKLENITNSCHLILKKTLGPLAIE